jgi:Na+/H+ antiporter NhaD/arsenite permease-like protein
VDVPTIVLLFALMVVSAQMRMGGFYTAVTALVGQLGISRSGLLGALIAVAASLSAVFSNDIVCLACTPVVVRVCAERRLAPVPFLVGLACAANIGSAATLIGNPQNMLIGEVRDLPFDGYLAFALPPVIVSLAFLWAFLAFGPGGSDPAGTPPAPGSARPDVDTPPFDAWQSGKGLLVAAALFGVFLFTEAPREVAALAGAGVLLLSRRLHSARVLGLVDWPLLVLFAGLFIVNHAFEATGLSLRAVEWLAAHGVVLAQPGPLFVVGVALSNLVSNVPAVMLLLPHLGDDQRLASLLAVCTTFAGNLLLVGSIANLIVVDLAGRAGVVIDGAAHARLGVPVTLGSLAVLAGWVAWLG